MEEIHCMVFGRVQMVMYRDFVKRGARALGLRGFVRNSDDGSVEVVAQGDREKLEQLVTRMHKGPLLSKVEDVRVKWREPTQRFGGFTIVF